MEERGLKSLLVEGWGSSKDVSVSFTLSLSVVALSVSIEVSEEDDLELAVELLFFLLAFFLLGDESLDVEEEAAGIVPTACIRPC